MCTDDVFSFCRFLQLFYNCYTVLMFALLVANWPFCINKFDLSSLIMTCSWIVRSDTNVWLFIRHVDGCPHVKSE